MNVIRGNVESIGDSDGQEVEDLSASVVLRNEVVVELPLEADLAQEAVRRHCGWNT
jgi:hypothetical protein